MNFFFTLNWKIIILELHQINSQSPRIHHPLHAYNVDRSLELRSKQKPHSLAPLPHRSKLSSRNIKVDEKPLFILQISHLQTRLRLWQNTWIIAKTSKRLINYMPFWKTPACLLARVLKLAQMNWNTSRSS